MAQSSARGEETSAAIEYTRDRPNRVPHYRELIKLTRATLAYADQAAMQLWRRGPDEGGRVASRVPPLSSADRADHRTNRASSSSWRSEAAYEKIVSLFEPHADIIVKGGREVEYGHKLNLTTGRSGLILAGSQDITENLKGIPTAWETAKEIRARIYDETKLTASAGISCNKFLAKLASDYRKPNGQFAIMPDQAEALVATLPVAKFHGVGPKTTAKMRALGIETGADLRRQTVDFLQDHFGKAGSWYYDIARGRDERPVVPDRERKSLGSETTFPEDRTDPVQIEAGVIAMANEVWAWCEKTNSRGRTLTVKIKWADFQISTRSRSMEMTIETREKLHQIALDLIRSVFPPPKGVRLVGVSLSNFRLQIASEVAELPFREL